MRWIQVGQKKLRCGYTTGTCATIAAIAATKKLLFGTSATEISLMTPGGWEVTVEVKYLSDGADFACYSVVKDGGDDPDVTHGAEIMAKVSLHSASGVHITGGKGVGRVTKPGLDQEVGQYAINSVPRKMIQSALQEYLCEKTPGLQVEISVPEGETLAKRTFNPRMGIVGGISILGTSGIVRPMSEEALQDSIRLEIAMLRSRGVRDLILSPGNYGEDFSREVLDLDMSNSALCSNYIGFALDCAVLEGFSSVLLVGHLGKLAKISAGTMQTHSKIADPRREAFCTHAALCGGERDLIQALYHCVTADAAVDLLKKANLLPQTMASMAQAMAEHLQYRGGEMPVETLFFSNKFGILGQSPKAQTLLQRHQPPHQRGREERT